MHTYLSLFSGCGGADVGFHQSGFRLVGAVDNDPHALEAHHNFFKRPVFNHTISEYSIEAFDSLLHPEKVDVVFSGAPCQGFSLAGNRDPDDERNSLLVLGGRLALRFDPRVFVSENVMGSVAGEHKRHWDALNRLFRRRGYKTQMLRFNCHELGMAQIRKRVIFFAWKDGVDEIVPPRKRSHQTLATALQGVTDGHHAMHLRRDDPRHEIARHIRPLQKLSNVRGGDRAVATWQIPTVFGVTNSFERTLLTSIRDLRRRHRLRSTGDADPVHYKVIEEVHGARTRATLSNLVGKEYLVEKMPDHFDLTNTFNGKFRRLSWEHPSLTVDTRFGNPTYFLHPEAQRGFSVREAARIQSFPDTFQFTGNRTAQYKMIGNAVPPGLSRIVASIVKSQLLT